MVLPSKCVKAMQIINKKMSRTELAELAQKGFGDMVKGVVDVSCGLVAVGRSCRWQSRWGTSAARSPVHSAGRARKNPNG